MTQPQIRVVHARPWRRGVVFFVLALLGVACLLVGYVLGQNQVFVSRVSNASLSAQLVDAKANQESLESQLVDARLNAQIQQEAASSLRQDLALTHKEIQALQEDVTFYKSLMAPGSLSQGIQISDLELTKGASGITYNLLLTQVAQRRRFISGNVRLDFIGRNASDEEQVLSLTDLAQLSAYPHKYKFRYFQNITGEFVVPSGFQVEQILVTVSRSGKEPVQAHFPFPRWD